MNGYSTVRDLGGGEHYEVHLAYDHHRRSPVVVKSLREHLVDDENARFGFEREVAVLERLSHPSLVRLFTHDRDAERPYMVLEHVDGPTLSSLIGSHGPIELHQLMSLGIELTSVVAYMHAEGLAHLDIKPSNVIMGAPAKLIDLSLAMTTDDAAALDHPVGSQQYMAPEQALPGERGTPGPASDVYGIGGTLFRAAAGFRAFPTAKDGRPTQLDASPRALPEFVPPRVRDIIEACLAPEATDRPTPDQLIEWFEPLLGALPTARLSAVKISW